jgi:RNA-directed DNA polymerase
MKVRHMKGVAIHHDAESCGGDREGDIEALTGETAGQPLSCEIGMSGVPTPLSDAEGKIGSDDICKPLTDSTQSKTLSMRGNPLRRNWEISPEPKQLMAWDGKGKAHGHKPITHGEKSDTGIVPTNGPNKGGTKLLLAEGREGRPVAKGNDGKLPAPRTQSRISASMGLNGVRQAAKRNKDHKFTALMHHITPQLLAESFYHLKRTAAVGIDEMTWREYENGYVERIANLWNAVQSGRYRALPARRVYIPKPNGKQRPLGIAALEDKIVQQATTKVLNGIYEADFLGFSYGFRPGRSQHQALDALCVGITRNRVNWVLDLDVQTFLDDASYYTRGFEV